MRTHNRQQPAGTQPAIPIRRTRFSDGVWIPAVKAAGLPPGTGFHALRHYYASLLNRHGESVKVVQARLGPRVGDGNPGQLRPPVA